MQEMTTWLQTSIENIQLGWKTSTHIEKQGKIMSDEKSEQMPTSVQMSCTNDQFG